MIQIILKILLRFLNKIGVLENQISYKINKSDNSEEANNILDHAAQLACTTWNKYISPKTNFEFELTAVNIFENTAARAFQESDDFCDRIDRSWRVEFNLAFLEQYAELKEMGTKIIAGIIMHEIAHIYGFGSNRWKSLFDDEGTIKEKYASVYPSLKGRRLDHDGDHWAHDGKLLSEHVDDDSHFARETVVVMGLLGHRVKDKPPVQVELDKLFSELQLNPA